MAPIDPCIVPSDFSAQPRRNSSARRRNHPSVAIRWSIGPRTAQICQICRRCASHRASRLDMKKNCLERRK